MTPAPPQLIYHTEHSAEAVHLMVPRTSQEPLGTFHIWLTGWFQGLSDPGLDAADRPFFEIGRAHV